MSSSSSTRESCASSDAAGHHAEIQQRHRGDSIDDALRALEGKPPSSAASSLRSVGIPTPPDLYQVEDPPNEAEALRRLALMNSSQTTLFTIGQGPGLRTGVNPRLSRAGSTQSRRSGGYFSSTVPQRPQLTPLQAEVLLRGRSNRDTLMPADATLLDTLPPLSPSLSLTSTSVGSSLQRPSTIKIAQIATSGLGQLQGATSAGIKALKVMHRRRQEKFNHLAETPQCPVHRSQYCPEHLYWVMGSDPTVRHEDRAALNRGVLQGDVARFDYNTDPLCHMSRMDQNFDHKEPLNHWFSSCRQCGLTFLKGSAGKAVETHPSHLSSSVASDGMGERAVTVWVDVAHKSGNARWTAFFGPKSRWNVSSTSPAVRRNELEFYAIADCLNRVRNDVWAARREMVSTVMYPKGDPSKAKVNSHAFELAAQRFTLIVISPVKSILALCPSEDGRVLDLKERNGVFRYITEEVILNDRDHWYVKRRLDENWNKEMSRVKDAISALSKLGVQVKFCYTPRDDAYRAEWLTSASNAHQV